MIGEDLTFANHKVYMAACSSAWTVNGKIFAKLTNGTKMKLDMHADVDRAFRRVMGGRQPEVQVEETDRLWRMPECVHVPFITQYTVYTVQYVKLVFASKFECCVFA